jgi:isopentenyl diphosphate isomerase/L-lactate dehydrogenase-like FMN-dependent dehydrogenase
MRPSEIAHLLRVARPPARAAGVIVSNHGVRQLDHLLATIDVLPRIVDAVGDRLEVLADSGFRRGSDIAAALARARPGPSP